MFPVSATLLLGDRKQSQRFQKLQGSLAYTHNYKLTFISWSFLKLEVKVGCHEEMSLLGNPGIFFKSENEETGGMSSGAPIK